MRIAPGLLAISVLILRTIGPCLAATESNSFAFRNVRVFDGERMIPRTDVLVREGRIAALGPGIAIPAGILQIDGTGETLLPGLLDSHVHVFPGAEADALRFGVTTVLDMFDLSHEFAKWRRQRESLAKTDEADTWAAGTGVTVKGGAPLEMLPPGITVPTLDNAAQAQPFVDARVHEGSDYIKLFIETLAEYGDSRRMPTLTHQEVCAVVRAAHRDGKLAIVHVQSEDGAREAIDCHADALAHTFFDRPADRSFAALAKRSGIVVETTLDVLADEAGLALSRALAASPDVAPLLSQSQKETLGAPPSHPHPEYLHNALGTLRVLHAAGVPILAGTDAPNPGTAFGLTLHEELQLLVQAGFTPTEALNAATALPAAFFHLGDRGRIAPGMRADLVLVHGDPIRDIGATLAISAIWKNGFPVDRRPGPPRLR